MSSDLIQCWTFWINEKTKRMFLIVDVPLNTTDFVVIMEIKHYQPGEERKFEKLHYADWVVLTQEEKSLKECIPSNNNYTLIKSNY